MNALARLEAIFAKASVLGDVSSVLHWDMATQMPDGGSDARGEQLATLKSLSHQLITAPEIPDLLDQAQEQAQEPWEIANLREMRRDWVHAAAVPADLVEALSKAASALEMVWRQARPQGDFKAVAPHLKAMLALVRQSAQAKAQALGVAQYDALLDQFEPAGRSDRIDRVFADLKDFLPDFLARALDAQAARPAPISPQGPFPIAAQRALGLDLMAALGFDFQHGRMDTSHHPFCGGYPEDVRITTRYDEGDFASAMMGVLHETGHALYDFGLPTGRWRHQPVGRARGMQIHESQSLLIEMQMCRSRAFLAFALPLLKRHLGGQGPGWEAENLYRLGTRVRPDFIRVEADEVTYPAHVIIRYELEKALIEDRLCVEDLPDAWNQGYRHLLGITPPDHRLGCLQDIHWYCGLWGYFPTYTLGAMTAAQLFQAARADLPDLDQFIAQGHFTPLMGWLKEKVHARASSLSTRDLLIAVTGQDLNAALFKAHLEQRYLA